MFDKGYDEPSYYPGGAGPAEQPGKGPGDYAGDAAYYAGAAAGAAKVKIKKYLPFVIVGIVVLIILFFVLSWFGAHQTVTFDVKELDGGMLSSARLTLKSGGTALQGYNSKSITGPLQVNLQPGDYTYTVSASDHKSASGTIKVPSDLNGGTLLIELAKDIDAKFDDPYMDSTSIYFKQTVNGTITITNTGETDIINEEVILVPASKSTLDINFMPSLITVSAGSATSISFSASLNTSPTSEATVSRTIKLKGTTASKKISLTSMQGVKKTDVGMTPATGIKKESLTSGTETSIDIKVENNHKTILIRSVLVSVVPEADYEDTLSWIEFNQPDDPSVKTEKTIPTIGPKGEETLRVFIRPPANAEVGSEFKGNIVVSSLSIDGTLSIPISAKVTVQKTADLVLTASEISITCDTEDEVPCPTTASESKVALKNNGKVGVDNVSISLDEIKSEADCLSWVTLVTTSISTLDAGASKPIALDITPTVEAAKDYTRCWFIFNYKDPVTGESISYKPDTMLQINRTVK